MRKNQGLKPNEYDIADRVIKEFIEVYVTEQARRLGYYTGI